MRRSRQRFAVPVTAAVLAIGAGAAVLTVDAPSARAAGTGQHAGRTDAYPPTVPTDSTSAVLGTSTTRAPSTSADPTLTVTVKGETFTRGAAAPPSSGDLPFTGADVVGLSGAGLAMVVGGGAVYLTGRRRRGSSSHRA
jgi:hypothetical protein